MAVTRQELDGYPKFRFDENGILVTEKFMINWDNLLVFASEVLANGGEDCQHCPDMGVRARRISDVEGIGRTGAGPTTQFASYSIAHVTVEYASPQSSSDKKETDSSGQTYSESFEDTTEFFTLSVEDETKEPLFRWGILDSDDRVLGAEAPGVMVNGFDYLLTFYERPHFDDRILTEYPNTVNACLRTTKRTGVPFPPQTLLFHRPSINDVVTASGHVAWNIGYRFSYRQNGWNKFYRPSTGIWSSIYKASDHSLVQYYTPTNWLTL